MQIKEFYDEIGGDYEAIKGRLPNDDIIRKFLLKFPNEPSYGELVAAVEQGDIEKSFLTTHTLKGVAANLSFMKLYNSLSALTEQLRTKTEPADKELVDDVIRNYAEVINGINKLL